MITKIISSATAFTFSNSPVVLTSTVPNIINYSVTGYGNSIGKIWDTSASGKPVSGEFSVAPGIDFVAPLIKTQLPNYYFDAIIKLVVDGLIYPIGISNSPDNLVGYTGTQNINPVNIFWTDLRSYGLNNNPGNPDSQNNYLFGGDTTQFDNVGINYNINFSKPLAENLIATLTIKFFSYVSGYLPFVKTTSTPLVAGSTSYAVLNYRMATELYNLFGPIYYHSGYVEMLLSVDKPNYKSLLNYYHCGIG